LHLIKILQAMNANGGPQGPMGQQNMENFPDMLQQQRLPNGTAGGASQGNHALQDYRKTNYIKSTRHELTSSRNAIDVA
jgi:hypothetical protein